MKYNNRNVTILVNYRMMLVKKQDDKLTFCGAKSTRNTYIDTISCNVQIKSKIIHINIQWNYLSDGRFKIIILFYL